MTSRQQRKRVESINYFTNQGLDEATRIQGNRRNYPFMRNEVEIALKGAFYEEKWSTGAYLLKKYFLVNISRTGHVAEQG